MIKCKIKSMEGTVEVTVDANIDELSFAEQYEILNATTGLVKLVASKLHCFIGETEVLLKTKGFSSE